MTISGVMSCVRQLNIFVKDIHFMPLNTMPAYVAVSVEFTAIAL
jgi:hypothetical protein